MQGVALGLQGVCCWPVDAQICSYISLEGEAMALQEAIQVAIAKSWYKIISDIDSRTLVDRISHRTSGISEFNFLV